MRIKYLVGALLLSLPALAITTGGADIDRISHTGRVEGWTLIDHSHVMIELGSRNNYVLTLEQPCHYLSFAQHVGITNSNNTIYAGFDSLTADGWQCRIGRIQKVD